MTQFEMYSLFFLPFRLTSKVKYFKLTFSLHHNFPSYISIFTPNDTSLVCLLLILHFCQHVCINMASFEPEDPCSFKTSYVQCMHIKTFLHGLLKTCHIAGFNIYITRSPMVECAPSNRFVFGFFT